MTVRRAENGTLLLIDDCPAEDANVLLEHLLAFPEAAIDWRSCRSAHTAVIQVVCASGLTPIGPAQSGFLAAMIEPALGRAATGTPKKFVLHGT